MDRSGFYFDANGCIGCKSCESGCKDYNDLDYQVMWRKVTSQVHGTFPAVQQVNFSMACNNCEGAPCVKVCPTGAMYQDKELNLVQLDTNKCIGCRYCDWACLYGAIHFDEKTKKVSKCDLCATRLLNNQEPACVASCPTRCLQFGDINTLSLQHPRASQNFPGLAKAKPSNPNLLCEPLTTPPPVMKEMYKAGE